MTENSGSYESSKPHFTVIIGGTVNTTINADLVVQFGNSIEEAAEALRQLPPEAVEKINKPLADFLDALSVALSKNGKI